MSGSQAEGGEWSVLWAVVLRAAVEGLSDVAMEAGALGCEEAPAPGEVPVYRQPWDTTDPPRSPWCTFRCYADSAQRSELQAVLTAALSRLQGPRWPGPEGDTLFVGEVDPEDWSNSWKDHHHAVAISPRLRVSPPWEAQVGDLVIAPGMAFGTGDHPTTRALLTLLDRVAHPGESCLDVGCGSGVLALAAAKAGMLAKGIDIDPVAVSAAEENATANGLVVPFTTEDIEQIGGTYDWVVANLYAEVLVAMAPALTRRYRKGLGLAGILLEREHLVRAAFSAEPAERFVDGEWVCLVYR